MAKGGGKNVNPAEAYRKALHKKERKKANLAEEVERLEFATEPADKARLKEAKAELERIYQKKEEYLKEHPEQRRLVYRHKQDGDKPGEEIVLPKRNFFDKHGLPRHPERSVYYDPVMNPFGVAPPGMPYQERPRNPGEVYSDDSDDDEGPPPEEDEDSDDDIPMPEGPPPGSILIYFPSIEPTTSPTFSSSPSPSPSASPSSHGSKFSSRVPRIQRSPPPPNFPNFPPQGFPPPPPGFYPPPRNPSSVQDPLSSIPHQTFQAHRAATHSTLPPKPTSVVPPASASLPPKPVAAVSSANLMSATVFAAPELRDFKKEATAFVPSTKPGSIASGPSVEESLPVRPDLLGSLKGKFGAPPAAATVPGKVSKAKETQAAKDAKQKDDYDKFVESMSDILGSK
ncbi:hypothetical protein B0H17DRAFT_1091294 [Mycena rosella]|uniref:Uncharacterized protein n=1 Tax=Mycena rosella TaxID=1033263 RepID=A0AAD7CV17_MYCRO|nr:hypothetical protein B0H17DRAFT_1091294 [Mycena rosella]